MDYVDFIRDARRKVIEATGAIPAVIVFAPDAWVAVEEAVSLTTTVHSPGGGTLLFGMRTVIDPEMPPGTILVKAEDDA